MDWAPLCLAVVCLAAGLSGCVAPGTQSLAPGSGGPVESPRVVVAAVMDTGIQPYHEVFRLGDPGEAAWIRALPNVTVLGDSFREWALRDAAAWDTLELGALYWFEGTRVLAASFWTPRDDPVSEVVGPVVDNATGQSNNHPILDESLHGTAVASVIAQASPHAFVLMLEENGGAGDMFEWLDGQDWIDIVTSSRSTVAGLPIPEEFDPVVQGYARAWDRGIPVFSGSGNEPSPLLTGDNGPPWVVRVGGVDPGSRGASVMSGGFPDLVANYTHDHMADARNLSGYLSGYGTSFASPRVAAVAAEAVYQLRLRFGHAGGIRNGALVDAGGVTVTNADLRAALNATAVYWDSEDFVPQSPDELGERPATVALPVLPDGSPAPIGPWVQMGWGHLDEALVPAVVEVLSGATAPAKPPAAVAFMDSMFAAREAYWNG